MSTLTVTCPPNLIVGCGYLGRRVAARWLRAGKRVIALTRGNTEALSADGIEPIVADILDHNSLKGLPLAKTVLYAVGWDRHSGTTMREVFLRGLNHVLDTLPDCERFIYISSTGVYGQTDGGLVDETSLTEPIEASGKVVLDAEQLLLEKRPDAIVLRFAGMYGPNRLLRRNPLLAGEPLIGDADRLLNTIHIDDGVDAVLAAESRGVKSETYNIADDEPTTRRAFYNLLAELLHAPPARFDHRAEPGQPHRRVSNGKAKLTLNWQPQYPNYRVGLPIAVRESAIEKSRQ